MPRGRPRADRSPAGHPVTVPELKVPTAPKWEQGNAADIHRVWNKMARRAKRKER